MVDQLQQGIVIISFLLPVTALYIQGQAFPVPSIKGIGIQSSVVALLSTVLGIVYKQEDLLVLGGIIILTRSLLTPMVLLRVAKFRNWEREKIRGITSTFVLNTVFFFSASLVITFLVLSRVFPGVNVVEISVPFILFFQGMFLIASRKSTVAHILGYVELENALVALGIFLIPPPLLIDVTVFLDVLALVVISSIVIVEKREHEPMEELMG
ncbi:hydrogenase [Metallosphaera tengchongensis]|uniref:Hydrogenase n=1 Tax=Metallosphaera tengchongensis TaxID=1532350 RepID=A0A6N0NWP7_9CREN|nr:hydrogenase [Metallosphaera tengchongensis]QKR00625.1 hydrogenase [Metallosphaera tengchongensis]